MKKILKNEKIRNITRDYKHPSYEYELKLLEEIQLCELTLAIKTMKKINMLERASLSRKPLQSKKNSLVIWCSLFARATIEIGVEAEDAFSLSDVLINTIDNTIALKSLDGFEFSLIHEYIDLIKQSSSNSYPYPISKIVDYINVNAYEKITVAQLANLFSLHPDYLSKKFHSVVGITLSSYIQTQKVTLAKIFLDTGNQSITEIANLLNYNDTSYFSKIFKKHTNLTPFEYRKLNHL